MKFPASVELFDVEGIPVSLGNVPGVAYSCAAWDTDPPRRFSSDSALRNGAPVSEARFARLVADAKAAP